MLPLGNDTIQAMEFFLTTHGAQDCDLVSGALASQGFQLQGDNSEKVYDDSGGLQT